MGAELIEEPDRAVLSPKRDVVLAEQANWCRGVACHQVLRQRKRDPVVLPHQPTQRRVTLHPGHQLVLSDRRHSRPQFISTPG